MVGSLTASEESQLLQTIEMFEVITQSQPQDYQSLEILKEAYMKLHREDDVVRTSRTIAEAYVQLGQLSSAILEYESILQRRPDDAEILAALGDVESRASTVSAPVAPLELELAHPIERIKRPSSNGAFAETAAHDEFDDGKSMMHKLFVDGRLVSSGEFDLCWHTPSLHLPP